MSSKSTHAILRLHFNHLKASIIDDTLPRVCAVMWPGRKLYKLNRSDWYAEFENGSRIYFGGLSDKERTEKILGQEHSTIYLNEASTISFEARTKAFTRLAQMRSGLQLKEIVDENPPQIGHWTYQLWVEHKHPTKKTPLYDASQYACVQMNPKDNPHIPEEYKLALQTELSDRDMARFWRGEFGSNVSSPLWTYESIQAARVAPATPNSLPPRIREIVIAVDPSGCRGVEDKRSDEVGIVAVGVDEESRAFVLEDASGHMGPTGDKGWGQRVATLYHKWGAARVVGEINYGGAMVEAVILTVDPNIRFTEVSASKSKAQRADPVANLFSKGQAFFCGEFPEMESQLVEFSAAGYQGSKSPDRADAMVWGVTALGIVKIPGFGTMEFYRKEPEESSPQIVVTDEILMRAPAHIHGQIISRSGTPYIIENGLIRANADDVEDLQRIGFSIVNLKLVS